MACNLSKLVRSLEQYPGNILRPSDIVLSVVNHTKKNFEGSRSMKWFKWRLTEGCRDSMNTRIQKFVNRCYTLLILMLSHIFFIHTRIFPCFYAYTYCFHTYFYCIDAYFICTYAYFFCFYTYFYCLHAYFTCTHAYF